MSSSTCPRCGGYLYLAWDADQVCLNCGYRGPIVIADHRHKSWQGQPPTYWSSIALEEHMSASAAESRRRRLAKRQEEAPG